MQLSASIVLIGFMGAGKTSVAHSLAGLLSLPVIEVDQLISEQLGATIPEIFERFGEETFRDAETAVLRALNPGHTSVVATGGGVVLRPGNVPVLRALGSVVYLSADEDTLFARATGQGGRPLLQTAEPRRTLQQMLATRLPLYRSIAELTVDTSNLSPDAVAADIVQRLAI